MEKEKINGNNMNLINGELTKSKTDLENLENFIKRWQEKIKEIKRICLDNNESYNLANNYLMEWTPFMHMNVSTILNQLSHDLFLAISEANINYRKQFPTFLDRFHKLKLPDINILKK